MSVTVPRPHSLVGAHLHSGQLTEDDLVELLRKLVSNERLLALYQPLACLAIQLFHTVELLQNQGLESMPLLVLDPQCMVDCGTYAAVARFGLGQLICTLLSACRQKEYLPEGFPLAKHLLTGRSACVDNNI